MNVCDFICGLMRRNTDALGFIPSTAIAERWLKQGNYILQLDRFRKPVGYLLHGNPNDERTMFVHQAVIDYDRRNRGFGRQAVVTLLQRAHKAKALNILLRCAADLDAVTFWKSCGFTPIAVTPGGARRNRNIIQFEMVLNRRPPESDSGPLPAALRPNA